MKKIYLLVASISLLGSMANASEKTNFSDKKIEFKNFNFNEPISFNERGIAFYVFPNGEFDFDTQLNQNYSPRRNRINVSVGAPGVHVDYSNDNYGVRVEHDDSGRIRRVGNVFINYDYNNRIKRIGNVYMSYNRFALSQVGGLSIIYNFRGQIIDIVGSVNGNFYNNGNCGNGHGHKKHKKGCGHRDNDDEYENNHESYGNYDNSSNDDDNYYYKTKDKKDKKESENNEDKTGSRRD
jgi:hypothetical protein